MARLLNHRSASVAAMHVGLSTRAAILLTLATAMLTTACNRRGDEGPVVASVIGASPRPVDPVRGPLSMPSRLLLDSTAQGLVRFDAAGQIIPGLAERWIVIDNGMSYIFRLREAHWHDGKPVLAAEVVAHLRRQLSARSRNLLAPFLTAIDEIVEMTPQVIEVRLRRPRPDLLKLFAQPEMAVFTANSRSGTGPFRIVRQDGARILLRPDFDAERLEIEDIQLPGPEANVQLIGERAARAITRFTERQSDLVVGGTFIDWPLAALAGVAPANLRIDPAAGLFGLAIINRTGFLADAQNRAALSQAIDRAGLVAAFAPGWQAAEQILPDRLDSAAAPATPAWASLNRQDRSRGARDRVTQWRKERDGPVELRIALPDGPGATILFGFVGAAFRSIGVTPRRVPQSANADLRLVDEVAPYDSARWYLASACAPCGEPVRIELESAKEATTLAERADHLARADAAINADVPFIPLARPLRWSLVAIRLAKWADNSRAWHPLNQLRRDAR